MWTELGKAFDVRVVTFRGVVVLLSTWTLRRKQVLLSGLFSVLTPPFSLVCLLLFLVLRCFLCV